jgi:uncharacterized membrane protein
MFTMPEPLHPAVVHFPIVLLLLGTIMAGMALFVPRWQFPAIAALLLALGAAGAYAAVETGESAEHTAGELAPAAEHTLEEHEEAAERTEVTAGVAAALAIAGVCMGTIAKRRPQPGPLAALAIAARSLSAIVALAACVFVYETARHGGELVYVHGVGVKNSSGPQTAASTHDGDED